MLGFGLWQCLEPLGSGEQRPSSSRLWGLARPGHSQEPALHRAGEGTAIPKTRGFVHGALTLTLLSFPRKSTGPLRTRNASLTC